MTVLSIVLKSRLSSSNTQLGIIGLVHWGVKQLTHGRGIVSLKLNTLTAMLALGINISRNTGPSMC